MSYNCHYISRIEIFIFYSVNLNLERLTRSEWILVLSIPFILSSVRILFERFMSGYEYSYGWTGCEYFVAASY